VSSEVRVVDLGRRPYVEVLELQRGLFRRRRDGRLDHDVLLLVEHEPVVTLGRGADRSNLVVSEDWLQDRGVDVVEIERGGDVTYHGPGQLVGYPIVDLHAYRLDLHWYLRRLEETLLRVLAEFGLPAFRVEGYTGVWTGEAGEATAKAGEATGGTGEATRDTVSDVQREAPDVQTEPAADSESDGFATLSARRTATLIPAGAIRKVASIGVHASRWITRHGHASRWITRHGFALNVTDEPLEHFAWIVPCGIGGVQMTSLAREGAIRSMAQTRAAVLRGFDAALAPARMTGGSEHDLTRI